MSTEWNEERAREMGMQRGLAWLMGLRVRKLHYRDAMRREFFVSPLEVPTSGEAKTEVELLLGSLR